MGLRVVRATSVGMWCVPGLDRQERRHCLGVGLLDLSILSPGDNGLLWAGSVWGMSASTAH